MNYCFNADLEYFAFNSVFTRIWQFSLGILCSYFGQSKPESCPEEEQLLPETEQFELYEYSTSGSPIYFLFFSVLITSWYPVIEISNHVVRLLVCCQTAGLIYSGQFFPNVLLSNHFVVYLGDISYSLYLIHWPIYVYLKQNQLNSITDCCIGIIASILLASFVHETFEKFYLKLEKKGVFCLCLTLYLACFAILAPNLDFKFTEANISIYGFNKLAKNNSEYYTLPGNLTLEDAMQLNVYLSKIDNGYMNECNYTKFRPDEQIGWTMCRINNTKFSGSKKLMFLGNSQNPNIARMFITLNECQEKAADVYMYTRIACEVLDNTINSYCNREVNDRYFEAVKKIKPDVLFISDRHVNSMDPVNGTVDTHLEAAKGYLERIEKEVKEKVYILTSMPRPIYPKYTETLNEGLKKRGRINHIKLTDTSANYQIARDRWSKLAKICSKCELIDLMPSFTKNGVFQMYDESTNVQYFTNPLHFSQYGLHIISPVFRNVCKKL